MKQLAKNSSNTGLTCMRRDKSEVVASYVYILVKNSIAPNYFEFVYLLRIDECRTDIS